METVQSTGQEKAERVLSRIREKLGKELSVEYTVNMLIQEARNPENLAKIYVGELTDNVREVADMSRLATVAMTMLSKRV